jgi:hypothetical protein
MEPVNPPDHQSRQGGVTMVTGAGRRIGAATARRFATAGSDLAPLPAITLDPPTSGVTTQPPRSWP